MNAEKQPAVAGPVEPKVRLVSTWFGRPIDELTREELLEVVEWCGREILSLRADRDRWRESGDSLKYLMAGRRA
ncbi:MAG: hypothetical protein ACK5QX_03975 [bacterium]|jgi:hypothetical protein